MRLKHTDPRTYAAELEKFSSRLESASPARKLLTRMMHPWMAHAMEVAGAMKRAGNGLDRIERALLESTPDMILVMDSKGVLKHFHLSKDVSPLVPAEQFLGKNLLEALPPDLSTKVLDALARLANGESNSTQYAEHFIPEQNQHREMRITRIGDNLFSVIVRDTTAQKVAQEHLLESKKHYSSLFNNMLSSYVHGKMTYEGDRPVDFINLNVNPAFEAITGISGATGKLISEIFPGIREADPNFLESLGRVASTGKRESFEIYLESTKRNYKVSAYSQEMGHFMAIFDDITDMKNAEKSLKSDLEATQALAESNGKYHSLFKNMLDGYAHCKIVYEGDRPVDFIYLEVNKMFEAITGIKGATGKPVSELIPGIWDSGTSLLENYARVASTGKPESFEIYLESTGRHYKVSAYSQAKGHFMAIFEDVTDMKNSEEEIRRELMVDRAVASISKEILSNKVSVEFVSDIVLKHAMELTGSRHGYVSSINMETKEMLAHTNTKMLSNGCNVENGKITFPKGPGGYAGLWGHSLNTGQGFFTNEPGSHPSSIGLPQGHVPMENFLSVPAMQGGEAIGQIALSNSPRKYTDKDLQAIQTLSGLYSISLKRAQLEKDLLLFRESVEKAVFPTLILDANKNIIFMNNTGLNAFGYSTSEVMGKNISLLYPAAIADEKNAMGLTMGSEGKLISEEASYAKKDGTEFPALCSVSTIHSNLETYYVISMMDISELKHTQQVAEASATLESIGLMTKGLAHEIKNKLFPIMGYIEMELESEKDPEKIRLLQSNLVSVHAIDSVVKRIQITDKSRNTLDFEAFDVSKCVENAAIVAKPFWHDEPGKSGKAIYINVKKPETETFCFGNSGLMQDVFLNLFINACHAMPEGGNIGVSIEAKGKDIVISVRDSGTGMPKEVIPRVFEPFFTTKITGEVRGTGLGLSLARKTVLSHKGSIAVESEEGKGTEFTIRLPIHEKPADVRKVLSEGKIKHARVLVVDDEVDVAEMAKVLIETGGHSVTAVLSGEAAIKIMREDKGIDIVVTDLGMAPLTGYDVAMEARRILEEEGRKIYVVLSSGWGATIDKNEAVSMGVDAFLEKPGTKAKYKDIVSKIMGMKDGQDGNGK